MKNLEQKSWQKNLRTLVFVVAVFSILFSSLKNSFAKDPNGNGVGRTRSCNIDSGQPENLEFDPTSGGKDVEFNLSNPVCTYVAISIYATVKLAIANMNRVCGSGSSFPRISPSPIQDSIDLARATITAATGGSPQCKGALVTGTGAFALAMSQIAIIYGIAKSVYNDSHVCGSNWMGLNVKEYDISTPNYQQTVKLAIEGYISNSSTALLSIGNKTYREWFYDGVEVEDNPAEGEEACRDPSASRIDQDYEKYPKQKYYLKGLEAGNFNCKRYLLPVGSNDPGTGSPITQGRIDDFQKAYNCCMSRSQNYICIHYSGKDVFCKAGSICQINGISFSAKALTSDRLICAETYSLCPYNFALSGGTEYCDYYKDGIWNQGTGRWDMITHDNRKIGTANENCSSFSETRDNNCNPNIKAGKCRNYCQYLTHCTKTSNAPFPYKSGLGSPYFSDACINFVGDSQNKTAFNGGGFILGSQRHFSAPIAQCVKETLENLFYNRAGHSSCQNVNEYPSSDGSCPSGLYIRDGNFSYKKGNTVKDTSFFGMIQNNMQNLVKLTITMSIMFYGMNILVGKNNIGNKKDILTYIFKIAMVLYFATGDAWQTSFFKGVYGAGAEFSRMVFKIGLDSNALKQDGCQFGTYTLANGTTYNSGRNYPAGKEYLALWDTLDCKIMRYLGYGPEASVANIASLIFAAFFTGPPGFYFAISVLLIAFFFIAATIRALHIFLSACMSIIIFVFASPLIIPLCLFKKTENIFKGWLTNLISFCFQPIILFAYIAIFCTIIDKTMIGSATFVGDPPSKTISCKEICKDSNGIIVPFVNGKEPACDKTGEKLFYPKNDSVACLINLNDFGKDPGFEIIGIGIPILHDLLFKNTAGDIKAKLLTILRGFLVMFLLYKFMDEIPGIASSLIGGTKLPGSQADALAMLSSVAGMIRGAQLRGFRGGKKAANSAYNKAKEVARDVGSSGKSVSGEPLAKGEGNDNVRGGEIDGDQVEGEVEAGDKDGSSSEGVDEANANRGNSDIGK